MEKIRIINGVIKLINTIELYPLDLECVNLNYNPNFFNVEIQRIENKKNHPCLKNRKNYHHKYNKTTNYKCMRMR